MKTRLVLALSAALFACSSEATKPPPAQVGGDAGPIDAGPRPITDGGADDADAAVPDAGVGPQCPPTGSMNRVGIHCAKVGDNTSYACVDSKVYGSLWRCDDDQGVPTQPPMATCVATARDVAKATTDYLCAPAVCSFNLMIPSCEGATQVALICPKGIATPPACPAIVDDAGTSTTDNFCCPR